MSKPFQRVRRVGQRSGSSNPNWKGGKNRKFGDYYYQYSQKPHPRAVKYGDTYYVPRAIAKVEEKLGRRLRPNELVHHRDGIKANDSLRNLKVVNKDEHRRIHSSGMSNEQRTMVRRVNEQKAKQFNAEREI